MPIDLNQPLRWKTANTAQIAMLDDLQGNILKGHGHRHAAHVFCASTTGHRFAHYPPTQDNTMTSDPPIANPILKAITVRLSAEAGQEYAAAPQELVLNALAAALIAIHDSSSLAWTVQAVPGGEPLLYDLTPLLEHPVSVKEAWEMTYALRDQPQVTAAEPTFVTPRGPADPSTTTPD